MAKLLGVDTGGTYTDAVIFDDEAGAILSRAKALTSHEDLSVGVAGAVDAALAGAGLGPEAISLVSLSTTLATNALVEGRGEPAGLVLIGFREEDLDRAGLRAALGDDPAIFVAGGHGSGGGEAAAFDSEGLEAALEAWRAGGTGRRVAAFAVAGVFATRNPGHELRAREIVAARTGLSATCSHELSARLGGPRRALTTFLNARLIGVVHRLISATEALLAARGVRAPLMVVKGDGALMSAAVARARPIETILSGPAASAVGAAHLTGLSGAVVADIGGTTTDIAVLAGGRPRIDPEGARVGGWRTMVEAVAMRTHGLGGDSEVGLEETGLRPRLTLGPRRAVPVSLFAMGRPWVREALAEQLARVRPEAHDGVFAAPGARRPEAGELDDREAAALEAVGDGAAVGALGLGPRGRSALARLFDRGALRKIAFTPSDAAHVLGRHDAWDRGAAEAAAALFARRRGNDGKPLADGAEALSRLVVGALTRRSAELVAEAALAEDGFEAEGLASSPLGAAALGGRRGFAAPGLTLTVPLIGLGASAPVYYPDVAQTLGAEAAIPVDAGVANAVGAVVGRVEAKAEATILSSDGERFELMAGGAPAGFADLAAARARAEEWALSTARARAEAAGAGEVEVTLDWTERRAAVEAREILVETRLVAVAVGRPRFGEGARTDE